MGGGHQFATMAYNTFAMSTLLFIGQLENSPVEAVQAERQLVTTMYPGPGCWMMPGDVLYAKESCGFSKSVQYLEGHCQGSTAEERHSWLLFWYEACHSAFASESCC